MQQRIKHYFTRFFRSSWVQHILFWVLAYFILLSIFAGENYRILDDIFNPIVDSIYTVIFSFTLFLAVTANLYVSIPLLLKKKHYFLYILSFLLLILGFSLFNQLLFDKWIDYILPDFYFISYYDFWDIVLFFTVFLIVTTLLKLSKEWFELFEDREKAARLEKEKAEAELRALMGQINPHFLFNSLNVLYNLALKASKDTPGAIVKLSDILRYVIYKAGEKEIFLKSEISLLQNYIDLQRYRIDDNSSISFETSISEDDVSAVPMLFLPLVENAFKHGIKGTVDHGFINIYLSASKDKIDFIIENNKSADAVLDQEKPSGIGLKNIADRLQLIYPDKHHFEIFDKDDKFKVKLTILL